MIKVADINNIPLHVASHIGEYLGDNLGDNYIRSLSPQVSLCERPRHI